MWCWRRMEKISWTNWAENKEVLHSVKGERNIPDTTQREKANWNGHTLRKNCLLTHVIERKREEKTRKKTPAVTGCPYGKENIVEFEIISTRSHSVDNSFWKRLWTSRQTDYTANIRNRNLKFNIWNVHYEIGTLNTVCPSALIIAAVYAIPLFRRICSSLL